MLCPLLRHLEQVRTSRIGNGAFWLCGASQGEPVDSAQNINRETQPGLIRAMGEDEFLYQKTRLKRHHVH